MTIEGLSRTDRQSGEQGLNGPAHDPSLAPEAVFPSQRSVLERTAVGTGWIVGWRIATRVLGLFNTLVLIRLLVPADFGLVALGSTFSVAVDTLSELGVENSLVREASPTRAMYGTAFTLTLLRGIATAVLIAVAAVPVARFFAEPRLAYVLWAVAVVNVIRAGTSIGTVDFRRNMDFRKEFLLQIVPRICSVCIAIAVALITKSYWALIAGIATGQMIRTWFSYRMHPWRPHLTLSAWRYLFGFSAWSWAISMAELVRDRMDAFIIGRVLNASAIGIFAIGEEIAALPTTELIAPMCRSCFSGFSATRAAGNGVTEAYVRPVAFAFMLTFPAGLGLSLVADPLVRLAVGERWLVAIPVIEVMAPLGSVAVFGIVAATLLSAYGLLRRQFVATIAAVALRLALIIPLVDHFGVLGAAIGAVTSLGLEHIVLTVNAFRQFGMRLSDLVSRVWRIGVAGAAMVAVLAGAGLGWAVVPGDPAHVALALAGSSAFGAGVYGVVLASLWALCGKPAGAESDALTISSRVVAKLSGRHLGWR